MNSIQDKLRRLENLLSDSPAYVIANSGGVDSMLLSYVAHNRTESNVRIAHAFSPAVPTDAIERIKYYANTHGWQLSILDAKEIDDHNYKSNPVNRCYFCKTNLYARIECEFKGLPIYSGTNIDDLSDYRPGLIAASENHVRHIYVEADINKDDIYALASYLKLSDLESLPSQPCLASRIETGIVIQSDDLHFINKVESAAKLKFSQLNTVRCRLTHSGVRFEIGEELVDADKAALSDTVQQLCSQYNRDFSGLQLYKKGSAFIHAQSL